MHGPGLTLLNAYPQDGAGVECAPDSAPECGVPTDAPIQLRFDRFLLPSTIVRQSLEVTTGSAAVFLQPRYDIVERVVELRLPEGVTWQPGTRYTVRLRVPSQNVDGWGFRAFDGAELRSDGPRELTFTFRTRRAPPPQRGERPPVTFEEVGGALAAGGCARAGCHSEPEPRMGLDLGSAEGLEATALDETAHQTDSEPDATEPFTNPARFGTHMPVVDRTRPYNSYLLYKVLVGRDAYRGDCESRHLVDLDGCVTFPSEEAARLRDWFVQGDPMPPPEAASELDLEDLRTLAGWLAAGAPVD